MAHHVLLAESAGEFFRPARLVELAIQHPLMALDVALCWPQHMAVRRLPRRRAVTINYGDCSVCCSEFCR
jgi:hypothetical protein